MESRRTILKAGTAMIGGAFLGIKAGPAASRQTVPSRQASVTGPIKGGTRGRPFGAFFGDISGHGYIEEEYFIAGEAQRFRPRGSLTPDGKWTFSPAGTAPFRTRILVRRPRDPAKFNGTVVVEWTNVTSGFELSFADSPSVYEGMAHVVVSAQQVGLHGYPGDKAQGLLQWDARRYGELSHPGDSCCYDIFSQVTRLVGPKRPNTGPDPMGGLEVSKLIAVGASQSAMCLTGYFNAIQPNEGIFDAFMILISPGGVTGYDDKVYSPPDAEMMARFRTPVRLRDDLATPVIVLNSEAETLSYLGARQPDSPTFRYWEIAGASHAPTDMVRLFDEKIVRDGLPAFTDPLHHGSDVMWRPSYDAALMHMHRWLHGGPPPPSQPRIDVVACDAPYIERDVYGNAKGGVRLPELVVPTARYLGLDPRPGGGGLFGLTEPFTPRILSRLYPERSAYTAQIAVAARAAEAAGVIPAYRTQEYSREAERAPFLGQ